MTRAGLLSAGEERELALAIRAARRAASAVVVAGDGEGELRVRETIQAGLDARRRLISTNLGWVITLSRRVYAGSVSIDELLQAGVIGLLLAVEHFDPAKGRFTTYATFLVRQEIQRAVEDAGLRVTTMHDNPVYRFLSSSAQGASATYGIKSISLLAIKTS